MKGCVLTPAICEYTSIASETRSHAGLVALALLHPAPALAAAAVAVPATLPGIWRHRERASAIDVCSSRCEAAPTIRPFDAEGRGRTGLEPLLAGVPAYGESAPSDSAIAWRRRPAYHAV